MATEAKPAFRIAPKSPEQLGDLFLDVAMHVFAAQSMGSGQESADHCLDDAFRRAARFVERAIALQDNTTPSSIAVSETASPVPGSDDTDTLARLVNVVGRVIPIVGDLQGEVRELRDLHREPEQENDGQGR